MLISNQVEKVSMSKTTCPIFAALQCFNCKNRLVKSHSFHYSQKLFTNSPFSNSFKVSFELFQFFYWLKQRNSLLFQSFPNFLILSQPSQRDHVTFDFYKFFSIASFFQFIFTNKNNMSFEYSCKNYLFFCLFPFECHYLFSMFVMMFFFAFTFRLCLDLKKKLKES